MTLEINYLGFTRNNKTLFSELNFTLQAGDILQISGENGSGKSTLLRILAGLLEPHHGTVLWQGQSILKQRDTYQEHLSYIGHQNAIKPNLTVFENLQFSHALALKKINLDLLKKIIKKIHLSGFENTEARNLSAGQLRKLSLARLMLNQFSVWILDEPATALDSQGQELLIELLYQHQELGGIAVVATHQDFFITPPQPPFSKGGVRRLVLPGFKGGE